MPQPKAPSTTVLTLDTCGTTLLPAELQPVAWRAPQRVVTLVSVAVSLPILTATRHADVGPPEFSVLKYPS